MKYWVKTYYDKVKTKVENHFNGRFEISLISFKEGSSQFSGYFKTMIIDKFDNKEHEFSIKGISEKDFIEKINQIILEKRDDTIDSIIENYGRT